MKRMKNAAKYSLYILLCLFFIGCNVKERPKRKELVLETEHCKYYCLARNSFGCTMIVCECDKGYGCDASVTQ
jgi:hypothetical protein